MRVATAILLLSAASAFATVARSSSAESAALARAADRAPSAQVVRRSQRVSAVPTLGRKWAPFQSGYGKVRPAKINNWGELAHAPLMRAPLPRRALRQPTRPARTRTRTTPCRSRSRRPREGLRESPCRRHGHWP